MYAICEGLVLTLMVLSAVDISDESEKLTRATVGELKYDLMKNKILQIFFCATSWVKITADVTVKPSDTFYGLDNSRNNSFDGRNYSNKHQNRDQQESYCSSGNQNYHRGY